MCEFTQIGWTLAAENKQPYSMWFSQPTVFLKLANACPSSWKQNHRADQFLITVLCSTACEGKWIGSPSFTEETQLFSPEQTHPSSRLSPQLLLGLGVGWDLSTGLLSIHSGPGSFLVGRRISSSAFPPNRHCWRQSFFPRAISTGTGYREAKLTEQPLLPRNEISQLLLVFATEDSWEAQCQP